MVIKICIKCNLEEDESLFTQGKNICKKCRNADLKAKRDKNKVVKEKVSKEHMYKKQAEWRKNNPEKRKATINRYHEKHKEQEKEYYLKNKDKIQERSAKYAKNNREKLNEQSKNRRKDPHVKLHHTISMLVRFNIKGKKWGKSILEFLPYTIQELKDYLESLFEPWMNWDNHGVYYKSNWNDEDQNTWKWQLDHIIPQSDLPYYSMEDDNFKKCWALENLRPLSAKINVLNGVRKLRGKQIK